MFAVRSFVIRIVNIFRRSRLDADLAEQLEAHRELIKHDLMSRGMDAGAAEAAARRALGNDQLVRDLSRDEMIHLWINNAIRDVGYAFRSLRRAPTFTIAVVLTLALGIGANTAIFSVVDRILLRPLPFPDGDRLMLLYENGKSPRMSVNPANWLDWQRTSQTFESFAVWANQVSVTLTGQSEPERLRAAAVSHEFFSILGVKPLLGRAFNEQDDRAEAPGLAALEMIPRTAVISHALWQRRFSGDPNILGQIVQLDSRPVEIVGVMPTGFYFITQDTDVWLPAPIDRNFDWRKMGGRFIPYVVGRVKPGVSEAVARAEMENIAASLATTYAFNKDTSVAVIPVRQMMTGEVRASLLVLFAAVSVLLLIACSNVVSLFLARAASRRREIAIRASLGAGRGAIARQLLIEGILLAGVAGAAGVLIADWGVSGLLQLAPPNLVQPSDTHVDQSMLLYAAGIALLTGLLTGLAPAIPGSRLDIADCLRNGGRSITTSTRFRQTLIVLQVAMTVVLLCGAGLLVQSLLRLTQDPIGVDATNVLTVRVELPTARYNQAQQVAFFRQITDRLRSIPEVQAASAASDIPVSVQRISGTSFQILGQPEPASPQTDLPSTRVRVVTPGYFKTVGIPLLKGRDFTEDDQLENAPQAFVVNEAFAKKYFGDTDPLSASISVRMRVPDNPFGQIIGIVGDVKEGTLRDAPQPTVFYNEGQLTYSSLTLFVRSPRGPELTPQVASIVHDIDRNLPLSEVRMLGEAFAESLARERLNAVVSAAFAASALLLASLGLYGLLAFTVAERTNEIGIRMALGAQAIQVLRMIIQEGLRLVIFGIVLGVSAAYAASRFLESLVFGVTVHDPATFVSVVTLLILVSLSAALVPGVRATRVNPTVALRGE